MSLISHANQLDFDSDISRFESDMPSQPQWSLARRFRCLEECRHSRGLAVKGPVSGEEYRTSRTEGREFRRQSLLDEFSISKMWARERPETGCVSAETGSNPRRDPAMLLDHALASGHRALSAARLLSQMGSR